MPNQHLPPREREALRQRAWDEFKRTRDQQIAGEKRGSADALLEDKLRRINATLDQTE